jgi:predicted RNA-binding Zn-ribbon protein involved in translation (DUF1610 family)
MKVIKVTKEYFQTEDEKVYFLEPLEKVISIKELQKMMDTAEELVNKLKRKKNMTNIPKEVEALDDYFGKHQYGYEVLGEKLKGNIYHEEEVELILPKQNSKLPEEVRYIGEDVLGINISGTESIRMTNEEKKIEEDEYVKTKCPNCGDEMFLPRWQLEKHKEDKDYYCSQECRYNFETGNPGEEY